jgi:hypothetical protein
MDAINPNITIDQLEPITSLAQLLGPDPRTRIQAEIRAMERMSTAERTAAAYRGDLHGPALRAWATSRPHELPHTTLALGLDEHGDDVITAVGELPWILEHTPEFCGD